VDSADDGEIRMGAAVMRIPQYETFFAPVLQSCPMDLSGVSEDEIEKCSIITNSSNTSQFVSNTMRYVGLGSLYSYLKSEIVKGDSAGMKAIFATHIHSLKALIKLQNARIVHFDIKENNVIFDEKKGVPIIIDFGFSFTERKLFESKRDDDLNYFFWSYQHDKDESFVIDWCVEVDILNYITQIHLIQNGKSLDLSLSTDDIRELKNTVDRYITKIDLTDKTYFTDFEVDQYRASYHEFLFSYSGFTWRNLIIDLKESWEFWDNYALARTYSEFIRYVLPRKQNWRDIPFIEEYAELVKKTVFSKPGYRQGPAETLLRLEQLMAYI
jgi:serine/threonine protein kinase